MAEVIDTKLRAFYLLGKRLCHLALTCQVILDLIEKPQVSVNAELVEA